MIIGMLNSSGERAVVWGYNITLLLWISIKFSSGDLLSILWCLSAFQQKRHVSSIEFDMKTATRVKKAYLYRTIYSCSVYVYFCESFSCHQNTYKQHCVFVNLHIIEIYPVQAKKRHTSRYNYPLNSPMWTMFTKLPQNLCTVCNIWRLRKIFHNHGQKRTCSFLDVVFHGNTHEACLGVPIAFTPDFYFFVTTIKLLHFTTPQILLDITIIINRAHDPMFKAIILIYHVENRQQRRHFL